MANENVESTGAPASGSTDTTGQQTQNPSGGGQAPVAGANGSGNQGGFTFKEDRSDWVPRHRLNELSERNKQYEARLRAIEEGQQSRNTEIARALGVNVPTDEEKEAEELRQTLYKLVPSLKHLEKLDLEKLEQIERAAVGAADVSERHWKSVADSMFSGLETEVADAIGVETLTPSQQEKLRLAYIHKAQAAWDRRQAIIERGGTPPPNDFLERHERGDRTLLKEFAKEWLTDWAEPVRRQTQAQVARRNRPVPSGERTRALTASKMPEVNYNDDEDFKKALITARNGG